MATKTTKKPATKKKTAAKKPAAKKKPVAKKGGPARVDIKKTELRAHLRKGLTLNEIAEIYGCHPSTVSKRKREYGL